MKLASFHQIRTSRRKDALTLISAIRNPQSAIEVSLLTSAATSIGYTQSSHSRRSGQRGNRGYFLIELVVYFSLFLLVTGLAYMAFYQAMGHSRSVQGCAEDIARALKAGESWRQDIRTATAPPNWREVDGVQYLQIPQGTNAAVYFFNRDSVWRFHESQPTPVLVLKAVKQSTMKADNRSRVSAWRWELELQGRKRHVNIRPLFTFASVPVLAQATKATTHEPAP